MKTATKIASVLYLKNEDGKVFELKGAKFNKLRKELLAGRGGVEVCNLVESGYTGFVCSIGEDEVAEIALDNLDASYFE